MSIDKINPTTPSSQIEQGRKTSKTSATDPATQARDAFALTPGSQNQAAFKKARDIINNTPDIRADVVANAKANLESLTRPSEDVLDKVAERLFAEFGLQNNS